MTVPCLSDVELTGSKGPFLGAWQQTNGGGGSSAKTTLWEAGHRQVGIAAWPGVIKPGTVSPALASTLDYFPTLAALAKVPLPADRVYDGVDLSAVLRGQAATAAGRTALFHPNSGASGLIGYLDGVRMDTPDGHQFKAIYETGGAAGCGEGNRAAPLRHDPPLLFDLSVDPAEAHPLDRASHGPVLAEIKRIRAAKLKNVLETFHSVANYEQGPAGPGGPSPCCNPKNVNCRCTD